VTEESSLEAGYQLTLKPKMDEDSSEIFIILFNAMVQFFDMSLVQKTQNLLFQLAAAFAGNNFNQFNPFIQRFLNDAVEFSVNLLAAIVNVVEVKFKFSHSIEV
jgi:hypothetical protein